jgi:hypothetical protein
MVMAVGNMSPRGFRQGSLHRGDHVVTGLDGRNQEIQSHVPVVTLMTRLDQYGTEVYCIGGKGDVVVVGGPPHQVCGEGSVIDPAQVASVRLDPDGLGNRHALPDHISIVEVPTSASSGRCGHVDHQ